MGVLGCLVTIVWANVLSPFFGLSTNVGVFVGL